MFKKNILKNKVAVITGGAGLNDLELIVPSKSTARIQEIHMLIGHILCELIEEHLNLK